ncbi:penicillin-binding protein 1A [Cohaesibacter sp. ES.047]|uniref:transglycosylase domain-containing protein n=1 Tax=Cohaesibacter sp. ES.047 TaxID=1798205 RepID=UPI000BB7F5A6|nr:transglycosylase domain-containing protein [Cohaesibacter sp. ES.047]SNY90168.1 penicillin-binding protein 1A [Cohaesibacter sp. ES.047]
MPRQTPPSRAPGDIRLSEDDRSQPAQTKRRAKKPTGAKKGAGAKRTPANARNAKNGNGSGNGGGRGKGPSNGSGNGGRRKGGRKRGPKSGSLLGRMFRVVRELVYWLVIAGLWGGIIAGCILLWYGAQLPRSTDWRIPDRPPNIQIVSLDGALVANRGETGGQKVRISSLPPYLVDAVVAIEDHRFYSHFGFDPIGFTRAMVTNIVRGRLSQGGSTLSQQLAKNLFLEHKRTIERKVQELILAIWLETKFSKDEILEMYLNRVYLGSGATGVDAAARTYYNKPASMLTLSEAATIAGLLKAPSRLAPNRHPKAARARAKLVLAAMAREGFITPEEQKLALTQSVNTVARHRASSLNYIADWVMEQVPDLVGDMKEDLIVETTIDMRMQTLAETAIADAIEDQGKKYGVSQGALVSATPDGAVRAMVGGKSYRESQFNRAVNAKRQPGSSFKPFVYLASLERGNQPNSLRVDEPISYNGWTPQNYSKKYVGQITLRKALALSINTIAAQLTFEVGPQQVAEVAHRLGIHSKLSDNLSIALGTAEVSPLEMVGAYLPFANGGIRANPYVIQRIVNKDGEVLYLKPNMPGPRVIEPQILSMMNSMMQETLISGTGKKALLPGRPAGGKTGTTQNYRDAWFVGYTANLVTDVWFGNDDGSPTKHASGGNIPAATWKKYMVGAHNGMVIAGLPGVSVEQLAETRRTLGGEKNPWINPDLLPADQTPPTASAPEPKERKGFFSRLFGN